RADADTGKHAGAVLLPFARRELAERPRAHGRRAHLRILYLQPCPRLGGAERQAATAIPQLGRFDIDVVPVVGPTPLLCRWLEQGPGGGGGAAHVDGGGPPGPGSSRLRGGAGGRPGCGRGPRAGVAGGGGPGSVSPRTG